MSVKIEDLNPACRDNPFGMAHCFHPDASEIPRLGSRSDHQVVIVMCCFCGTELQERHGLRLRSNHSMSWNLPKAP